MVHIIWYWKRVCCMWEQPYYGMLLDYYWTPAVSFLQHATPHISCISFILYNHIWYWMWNIKNSFLVFGFLNQILIRIKRALFLGNLSWEEDLIWAQHAPKAAPTLVIFKRLYVCALRIYVKTMVWLDLYETEKMWTYIYMSYVVLAKYSSYLKKKNIWYMFKIYMMWDENIWCCQPFYYIGLTCRGPSQLDVI